MGQFLKVDEASGNPSRWTRFPGGTRHLGDHGNDQVYREQRLIALNQGTSSWGEFLTAMEQEKDALRLVNLGDTAFSQQRLSSTAIVASTDFEEHARYGITYNGNKPIVNLAVVSRVL